MSSAARSTTSNRDQPVSLTTPKIHTACDECRARKLKCSSTTPPCARCEREGVPCVYSPMKTMGRPRKRRKESGEGEEPREAGHTTSGSGTPVGRPTSTLGEGHRAETTWDVTVHDASVLNGDNMLDFGLPEGIWDSLGIADAAPSYGIGDAMPGRSNSAHSSQAQTSSLQNHSTTTSTPSRMTDPQLSTPLAPSPPCSCLPSTYLMLNTLQTLTSISFPYILSPLRQAISTAHSVLTCNLCAQNVSSAMVNVHILHALLQSILEKVIIALKLIDKEAEELESSGATKQFRIGDSSPAAADLHTGTWDCPAAFEVDLKGMEWRRLARKAMKSEIKGISVPIETPNLSGDIQMNGHSINGNGHIHSAPIPQHAGPHANACLPPHMQHQLHFSKITYVAVVEGMVERQNKWHADPSMNKIRDEIWGESQHDRTQSGDLHCVSPLKRLLDAVDRMNFDEE